MLEGAPPATLPHPTPNPSNSAIPPFQFGHAARSGQSFVDVTCPDLSRLQSGGSDITRVHLGNCALARAISHATALDFPHYVCKEIWNAQVRASCRCQRPGTLGEDVRVDRLLCQVFQKFGDRPLGTLQGTHELTSLVNRSSRQWGA